MGSVKKNEIYITEPYIEGKSGSVYPASQRYSAVS